MSMKKEGRFRRLPQRFADHLLGDQIVIGCRRTNNNVCLRPDTSESSAKLTRFTTEFGGQTFGALFCSIRKQDARNAGIEQMARGEFSHLARADQ